MGLVNRRKRKTVGGVRVVVRPISIRLAKFYIRFGCVVILRAIGRKRKGTLVFIRNHYFVDRNAGLIGAPEEIGFYRYNDKTRTGYRRTSLSEYLIFIGSGSPGLIIKGVLSQVLVKKGDDEEQFITEAGKIDPNYILPDWPTI